jgi:hypothetical protein
MATPKKGAKKAPAPAKKSAKKALAAPKKLTRTVGKAPAAGRTPRVAAPRKTPAAGRAAPAPARRARALAAGGPSVLVVNMIPNSLSGESNQDSEPTLTVNPSNPLHIAASAFTPDPTGSTSVAPIYVSTDGGNTWTLNSIIPTQTMTADITVSFGMGDRLYAGIIRQPIVQNTPELNVLRADNFQATTPMTVILDRLGSGVDQPYVQALTNNGADRLYVGDNDFNNPGATATIDECLDAGQAQPQFTTARLEQRNTPGQDGPPIRPCPHADGTVYAVFHSWRTFDQSTGNGTADVVVVRDDNGGAGNPPFTALTDAGDGTAGTRVAQGVNFNFGGYLGLQRTGGDVAIAVDPTNSSTVYVAYNENSNAGYLLHVVRSTDRGATWSAGLLTVANALNACLAVNSNGTVALLYQQLTGTDPSQLWVTACMYSPDGANWQNVILASTPATNPQRQFDPYLGDYEHLLAVGKDFYGIFAASNIP